MMLNVPAFREQLLHEMDRPRNPDLMADVFDAPRWAEIMGPPTRTLTRIGVQYCVDGIPAFTRKSALSVKPAQFIILSLPPWLRYQARHMLVQMLIPSCLKDKAAKKYYDFVAKDEMNELRRDGVGGVRVLMYGDTLDAPGRRELLSMESVSAFYPCPHCLHTCETGLRKQIAAAGNRRCLARNSRWRQREFTFKGCHYMFKDVETRSPPVLRDDGNVSVMVSLARTRKPFCGHKMDRFLSEWTGIDWAGSACDMMHDLKGFCDMLLKGLVGNGQHGMYKGWNKDAQHRDDCEAFGIFREFHEGDVELPPWRLSPEAVQILDITVKNMWVPHYTDKLYKSSGSFWIHSDTMWKCRHKYRIVMTLLPTLLSGFVPAVHEAVLMIVYSLRRLLGQCISASEARQCGVLPGSPVVKKSCIPGMKRELAFGLVLLEGSFPVSHLNPNTHHMSHYGDQTMYLGMLKWLSMWAFERNNKRVKGFVRDHANPLSALTTSLQQDIATRLKNYSERPHAEFAGGSDKICDLRCRSRMYILSALEKIHLGMKGVTSFRRVRAYNIARILGVHFKAGEWGRRQCGSVITFMFAGRSRYCIVKKFLQVQCKSFARVIWLSKPSYPHWPNKLVVKVSVLRECKNTCVIPVERIEPCSVSVIPLPDGIHYYMLREKGYDRVTH